MDDKNWLIDALREQIKIKDREIARLHQVIADRFDQGVLSALIGRVAGFSDKSWKG